MKKLGSQLALGILVTTLSILATLANYVGADYGGKGDSHTAKARQHLADANREEGLAMQLVILDASMFDNMRVYDGKDDELFEYFYSNLSPFLLESIERNDPFDDQYYAEMYALADEYSANAKEEFALADAQYARQGGLRIITLISAMGLSFAAYASLLDEENRLRAIFAAFAAVALILVVFQFVSVFIF